MNVIVLHVWTPNNCWKFPASVGVILQSFKQSSYFLIFSAENLDFVSLKSAYENCWTSLKFLVKTVYLLSKNLSELNVIYINFILKAVKKELKITKNK